MNPRTSSLAFRYEHPRVIFIAGFMLEILLWFIPTISITTDLGAISISSFRIARSLFLYGQNGAGLLVIFPLFVSVVILVLAMKYPRRWVFICGACFAVLVILWGVSHGSADLEMGMDVYFAPRILSYVGSVMGLIGFIVKPPLAAG
jgi:hypothetical protein